MDIVPQEPTTTKYSAAESFDLLDYLHRGGTVAHYWTPNTGEFYTDAKGERAESKHSFWFPVENRPSAPAGWADRNVYFCVHPCASIPDKNKAGKVVDPKYTKARLDYVSVVNCFFGEFDAKDYGSKASILEHLKTLPLYPSIIVDSGGGFHCYWLLDTPCHIDDENRVTVKAIQYAWVDLVKSDNDAKDLARVLRVPGTKNLKYGPDFPTVTAIHEDYAAVYRLAQFDELTQELRRPKENSQKAYTGSSSFADDIATAARCLKALASHRRDEYGEWVKVGMALTPLGQAGLQLWEEWSQGSSKYEPGDCEKKWKTFDSNGLGIGSLVNWAKEDSPGLWHTDDPYKQLTNLKTHTNGAREEGSMAMAQPASEGNFLLWEKWDDEGNAQCVHRLFPGQFLHSKELGWLHHTGTHWTATGAGATLDRAIVAMLRARRHEAVDADNEKMIKAMAASQGRKNGAKDLFSSIVDCRHDRFNADPWLLNVQNGTIDLRTGDLHPHCKDDLITKMAPVDYDLVAKCPRWLAFLDRIFAGDKDLIAFVQRAVGYSLTAATTEHKLFFAYGGGNNGKSTFFEALAAILGDYWQKAPTEMIMIRKFTGIPNDIARMFGARMVVCAEVEEGQQLAESKVKDLTGGDTLTARFLNKEFFDFKPTHKLWLYGNHKPVITGTDHGVWRRINLIPFLVTIPKEEINPKLGELLMQEASGILSWAVAGCLDWQRNGLNPPAAVLDATKEYRNESDLIGAFLQECTVTGEWERVQAGKLYKTYISWCEQSGEKPVTNTRFGRSMVERGIKKTEGRLRFYEGIGLIEDDQPENQR